MRSENSLPSVSGTALWTGRILSVLAALFLLFDGAMKLAKPDFVVEATVQMGFSESVIIPLGIVLLVCTVLYLVPPTAVLGAILLTGYLGGAVATHVRAGHGWFQTLFPTIFGVLLWGGLVLRDRRLRSLVPWRSSGDGCPGAIQDAGKNPLAPSFPPPLDRPIATSIPSGLD
jgi:hypothetical protein